MEGEMTELEEKMKTITKLMVLKERQTWTSERQQLLNEKRILQKKLSDTEAASSKEIMGQSGDEISSLSHQLYSLKEKHDSSRIIFRRELIKERQRAQEEVKKERWSDHLSSREGPSSGKGYREDSSLCN